MDSLEVPARSFCKEVVWLCRSNAEHGGVEVGKQLNRRDVLADFDARFEDNAFLSHQVDAALNDQLLVELHVRNAVHQQAAEAVGAFEHGDFVTGTIELCGTGQARRS